MKNTILTALFFFAAIPFAKGNSIPNNFHYNDTTQQQLSLITMEETVQTDTIDSFAADEKNNLKKDTTLNKKLFEIDEIKKIISTDENSKDLLGRFITTSNLVYFNSKNISTEKPEDKPKSSTDNTNGCKYSKIELFVKQSAVYAIRVILEDNRTFEISKHIELKKFNEVLVDLPIPQINMLNNETLNNTINLSNTVVYRKELDNSFIYSKNRLLTFTGENQEKDIFYETGLNSLIEYRIYSDLLGLFNEEENGLVQASFGAKVNANLCVIHEKGYLLRTINPFFNVSKFDNSIQSIIVSDYTEPDSINKTKVDQLAFINFGVNCDLYSFDVMQHRIDLIRVGAAYSYTSAKLQDDTNIEPLNIITLSVGAGGQILKYKNFGLDFSLMFAFKEMRNKNFKSYDSYDPYYNVGACLFYNPINNPGSKIFLRFNSVEELKSQNKNFGKGYYSTIQFGYSATVKF